MLHTKSPRVAHHPVHHLPNKHRTACPSVTFVLLNPKPKKLFQKKASRNRAASCGGWHLWGTSQTAHLKSFRQCAGTVFLAQAAVKEFREKSWRRVTGTGRVLLPRCVLTKAVILTPLFLPSHFELSELRFCKFGSGTWLTYFQTMKVCSARKRRLAWQNGIWQGLRQRRPIS